MLLEETMAFLNPQPGRIYIDCTVGAGGHTREILERSGPDGVVIGIDRDPRAIERAAMQLAGFGSRFKPVRANFVRLAEVIGEEVARGGVVRGEVDGVLFDLGASSLQFDDPGRGFSYNEDAPLDMRMDPDGPVTAYDLVNGLDERELGRIFAEYGEERWASRIARFIVEKRKLRPIRTTADLVEIVKAAIPAAARRRGGHPARRTFQALRIATNGELDVIEPALRSAVAVTRPGGRVCAISFHSLEDRIVKRTFQSMAVERDGKGPAVRLLTRKPVAPGGSEVERNPRSRSARLRAAEVLGGF
ncbi:MAG: 16S rRNA (cytosine(1402)-N(4))-methyltransferase RsmH [Bacillota bacterium]